MLYFLLKNDYSTYYLHRSVFKKVYFIFKRHFHHFYLYEQYDILQLINCQIIPIYRHWFIKSMVHFISISKMLCLNWKGLFILRMICCAMRGFHFCFNLRVVIMFRIWNTLSAVTFEPFKQSTSLYTFLEKIAKNYFLTQNFLDKLTKTVFG